MAPLLIYSVPLPGPAPPSRLHSATARLHSAPLHPALPRSTPLAVPLDHSGTEPTTLMLCAFIYEYIYGSCPALLRSAKIQTALLLRSAPPSSRPTLSGPTPLRYLSYRYAQLPLWLGARERAAKASTGSHPCATRRPAILGHIHARRSH